MAPTDADTRDLFERNLAAFKEYSAFAYDFLVSADSPLSTLVRLDNGEQDIAFQGARVYGNGAVTYAENALKDHWANSRRLKIAPPQSSGLDSVANAFLIRTLRRAVDKGMEFAVDQTSPECFHCISFGIGLGLHLPGLVEGSGCKSLILVEPNPEFLRHSCHVMDWAGLIDRFKACGRHITFSFASNPGEIAADLRRAIQGTNICAVDGTHLFQAYPSPVLDQARQVLRKEGRLILSGLGFAADEKKMISNTYMNMRDGGFKLFKDGDHDPGLPVFIIGSGPSIDGCLEAIERNRERAIIISCGSALNVLVGNSIVPDFHLELENVATTFDALSKLSKAADFGKICLVGSTTIDPRVKSLFAQTVFYYRPELSSCPLFCPHPGHAIDGSGPLVGNLGLAFARKTGFREFYFFGMDLGTRNPEIHHSRHAPQAGETAVAFDIPVEANFGGEAFSCIDHLWGREAMESALCSRLEGRGYYNCSDGVAIEGMAPRKPETVSLSSLGGKKAAVTGIVGAFPPFDEQAFRKGWSPREWRKKCAAFADRLVDLCDDPGRLVGALMNPSEQGAEVLFFRGSLLMSMITVYYYTSRCLPAKEHPQFDRIAREELIHTIGCLKDMAGNVAAEMENGG